MAKISMIVKCERSKKEYLEALKKGKKPKFSTKVYNRCRLCGRSRGYMRDFQICRICFRHYASEGLIPGVTKSSW
jgi:small subunit ribosomal protein S14